MKIPYELWALALVIVGPLFFIEALHILKHNDHCKTYSEWERIYEQQLDE